VSLIRRNGDVIAAGMAGETILLNPSDWTYVHFNETAARIWEALEEPRTISGITDVLIRDYAVDRLTCEREAAQFVNDMSARGFVIVDP
jgi:hypothetical protein